MAVTEPAEIVTLEERVLAPPSFADSLPEEISRMSMWQSKSVKVSFGLLLLHIGILLLVPGATLREWLSNTAILATVAAATYTSWSTARREVNSTRYVWQLFTAGLLLWGLGQVCFMFYDTLLHIPAW